MFVVWRAGVRVRPADGDGGRLRQRDVHGVLLAQWRTVFDADDDDTGAGVRRVVLVGDVRRVRVGHTVTVLSGVRLCPGHGRPGRHVRTNRIGVRAVRDHHDDDDGRTDDDNDDRERHDDDHGRVFGVYVEV